MAGTHANVHLGLTWVDVIGLIPMDGCAMGEKYLGPMNVEPVVPMQTGT